VLAVVWAVTRSLDVGIQCNYRNTYYGLSVVRGSALVVIMRDWQFADGLDFFVEPTATVEQLEAFKKNKSWYHGSNSWWEGVGWTVEDRWRFAGFEVATGVYWPPFVMQHPKVPFSVYQTPLWALLIPLLLLFAYRLWKKDRRATGRAASPRPNSA